MTNTIVLLSVLLQTNWQDTTVMNGGMQIQVGRVMTNYVVAPSTVFRREDVRKLLPPPANTNAPAAIQFGGTYPILTSQPFFGPYNLVREVKKEPSFFIIATNISGGIIFSNEWKWDGSEWPTYTNAPARMPPNL